MTYECNSKPVLHVIKQQCTPFLSIFYFQNCTLGVGDWSPTLLEALERDNNTNQSEPPRLENSHLSSASLAFMSNRGWGQTKYTKYSHLYFSSLQFSIFIQNLMLPSSLNQVSKARKMAITYACEAHNAMTSDAIAAKQHYHQMLVATRSYELQTDWIDGDLSAGSG